MSALPSDSNNPIEVQTMSVSISTMRIGKKQVTLSMFKQLPEADIFTDGARDTLRVQPWGIVRYFWGDYQDKGGFHVVFVLDGALHRCWIAEIMHSDWSLRNPERAAYGKAYRLIMQRQKGFGGCVSHQGLAWQLENRHGYLTGREWTREAINSMAAHWERKLNMIWTPLRARNEAVKQGVMDSHNQRMKELKALPQLFIAV